MKKFFGLMLVLMFTLTLTACSAGGIKFVTRPFAETVYEEYLTVAKAQNKMINNALDRQFSNENKAFESELKSMQELSDHILLIMPIFDLGQSAEGKNAIYATDEFHNAKYKNISLFQVEQAPHSQTDTSYTYTMQSANITITYVLKVDYNSVLNQNEFKINLTFTDSLSTENNYSKYYLVRYDDKVSYFYFHISDTDTSTSYNRVEFYSLENNLYITRINKLSAQNNSLSRTTTDVLINNFDCNMKISNVSELVLLKGLNNVNGNEFGKITDSDFNNRNLKKQAFELKEGTITSEIVSKDA